MHVPSSTTQAPPPAHDPTRMATLEGNVTNLQNTVDLMAANMAEMMALLRGPNRASSSSTLPLPRGPTINPTPWVPPTHASKGDIAAAPAPAIIPMPAPHPKHASAIHPVDSSHPQSTIPATVSLPPMTIPVPNPVMFAPPPVSTPVPTTVYTAPPPMGFLASSAPIPTHTTEPFPYQAPQLHISLPYQAPPPINVTFSEPGTPTQAAPRAPSTNFFPKTETEQERRMKKMEETIRALQASDPRHSTSYLDSTLFPGMQLPAKVKMIMAGKQVDLGIKLGRLEGPTKKGEGESSRRTASTVTPTGSRRSKEASVNAVNTGHNAPQQYSAPAPPQTPQYRPPASRTPRPTQQAPASQGQQGGAMQARQRIQFTPLPIPLSHIYRQLLAGNMIRPTVPGPSFVPANQDQSLHCEYHSGSVGNLEQQFSVMGVTRSGRVYTNPEIVGKGKAPAASGAAPEAPPIPQKKVIEKEAEAFMKVIKASEYKQMNVDLNRIRPSKTAVRAFDSSRREVNGEIDLLIDVGPCSFSVTFQVLDIPNAFSLLLGRPWIHSAGAVPSSLHQRIKFIADGRLITIKDEEDYAIYKETTVPYISIGDDKNLPFHSFETISVIRDYGEIRPSRADRMVGKVLLRHSYVPGTGLGAQGQGINCPIEIEEGKHLYHLAAHYGKINRGIPVPPLSHFFPAPPHVIGGTLDGPSSVSDAEPVDPPAVCAVTEETPLGVHIRLAQENEELNNWTSVPCYSAVIADLHSNPNHRHVDSNSSEEHLEESRPIYFGEGLDEDGRVPEIEERLRRLEDRQFTSVEPTEEINVGTEEESRTLKIGTSLDPT
ncbi:hypothetical protein CRG98_014152 [Punica granatum]|uniref:G-patch domain-containing protein n=1 Tax=Punica granatum TaxID=22663 RepID=A0A2I0KB81_PUNGR|nr:hypothetical protein CRG98_014152 [Punica granatum]